MDFLIDSISITGIPTSESGYSPDRYYSKKTKQDVEAIHTSYCPDLVREYDLGEIDLDYNADPFDEHMQEFVEDEIQHFDLKGVTDWEDEKGPPPTTLVPHQARTSKESRYSTPSSSNATATSILQTLSSPSVLGYMAQRFSEDFLPSTANQIIAGAQHTYNEVSNEMDQAQEEEQSDAFACDVLDLLPYHAVVDVEELCTTRDPKEKGRKPSFKSLALANEFVPPIFFESKFELSNPDIYDAVLKTLNNLSATGRVKDEDDSTDASKEDDNDGEDGTCVKGNQSNFDWEQFHSPLHLFWDYSETALREQVKFRSSDYFMESASSRELEILIAHGLAEISGIQKKMDALRFTVVDEPKRVPEMATQRQNLQLTMSVLNKTTELLRQKRKITRMLRKNEARKALSVISMLQKDIQSTQTCHVTKRTFTLNDFAPIQAYNTKLNELGDEAAASLITFIIQRFIDWQAGNKPDPKDDSTADTLESPETDDELLEKLRYLKSIGKIGLVNEKYAERLGDLMYVSVKTILTECAADALDVGEKEASKRPAVQPQSVVKPTLPGSLEPEDISVAQELASMSFESFMNCVRIVLREILEVLSVATTVNRFLNDEGFPLIPLEKVGSRKPDTLALHAASDLAESLLAGLFEMRSTSLSTMSLDELTELYQTCSKHAVAVGELVGRRQNSILQCLSRTVRSFIDARHAANLSRVEASLDDERWAPCELSRERKLMLVRISQEGSEDALDGDDLDESCSSVSRNKVVGSLFVLMETMQWNISCASSYREFTATLVRKSADLMRSFNNRTLQLVVNGGATRSSARLKSIKLKHLAMTLNCVDLMMTIVPNIRAQLSSMTAGRASSEGMKNMSKIAFSEFDEVVHEIEKHTDQIIERVVAVMRDLLQHSRSVHLVECDFDAKASESTGEGEVAKVCPFFEDIVSLMCTTHRIFRDVVSEHLLKRLCSRLFSYIDQELPVILVMAATTPSSRVSNSIGKGTESLKSSNSDVKDTTKRQLPSRSVSTPIPSSSNGTKTTPASKKEQVVFTLPKTREGKKQMVVELIWLTAKLNQLKGVMPHSFTMANVLGRKLGIVKREKKTKDSTRRQGSSSSARSGSVNGSRASPNTDGDCHTVASSASSTGLSMESMPMELLTSLTAAISGAAASMGSDVESLSAPPSEASYSSEVESVASELSQLFMGMDAKEL